MDTTILKIDGRIYVKQGGRYIALINEFGDLNVKLKNVIQKIEGLGDISQEGFYYLDGKLYSYINNSLKVISDPLVIDNEVMAFSNNAVSSNAVFNKVSEVNRKISEIIQNNLDNEEDMPLSLLEIDEICNF